MKIFQTLVIVGAAVFTLPAVAQTTTTGSVQTAAPAPADAMTAGSIVKINTDTKKITVKHEAITNLDMPGMTMVFCVQDPEMLTAVKPGDSVQFHAEKIDGAITITRLQASQ